MGDILTHPVMTLAPPDPRDDAGTTREAMRLSGIVDRIAWLLYEADTGEFPPVALLDRESLVAKVGWHKAATYREGATAAVRELNRDTQDVAFMRALNAMVTEHESLTEDGRKCRLSFASLPEGDQHYWRHVMLAGVVAYRACLKGITDPIRLNESASARAFWRSGAPR